MHTYSTMYPHIHKWIHNCNHTHLHIYIHTCTYTEVNPQSTLTGALCITGTVQRYCSLSCTLEKVLSWQSMLIDGGLLVYSCV